MDNQENIELTSIIEKIKQNARDSWSGPTGEERAATVELFITKLLDEYHSKLGLSKLSILKAIEEKRNYMVSNYYQEANFPSLKNVMLFETLQDLLSAIPSKKFRCPSCNAISTNPYECNAGNDCNWVSYGFLRTMGKGLRFTIKQGFLERPIIDEIFMPLELEKNAI